MIKRFFSDPGDMRGQCREFAEFVVGDSGIISNFTRDTLLDEVTKQYLEVMSLPITPEQEVKARDLVGKFDAARIDRMNEGSVTEGPDRRQYPE